MPNNTFLSEKKKALLAYKEKILQETKCVEKEIEDFCAKANTTNYFEDSSDSEDDFPVTIDPGPTVTQLKQEQSELRTCLQATQELTNLQVLQSEVNITVTDPVFIGEPQVNETGTWREVTAECRIDLVPFSIMFYTHQTNGKFAATRFRGLRTLPVKAAHEAELERSVLSDLVRPSDAVEVIKNYAKAYRSRRTTLARLADSYATTLFMEPMAEGGYILKCANILQLSWRLENKWSPVAHFHHRMKFDLDYLDETYISKIAQAHKKIADPTITTEERTLFLSKIITTCLEAKGQQELSESVESENETVRKVDKRRTTLDEPAELPVVKKRKDEVMAPPKSIPKKYKTKIDDKTTAKRSMNDNSGGDNVKRIKSNGDFETNVASDENDLGDGANSENGPGNKENVARNGNDLVEANENRFSDKNGQDTGGKVRNVLVKSNEKTGQADSGANNKATDSRNKNDKGAVKKNVVSSKKSPENKDVGTDVKNQNTEKNKSKPKGVPGSKNVVANADTGSTVQKSAASKGTDAKNDNEKNKNKIKNVAGAKKTHENTESMKNADKNGKNNHESTKKGLAKDKNGVNSKTNIKTQTKKTSESINTVEKVVEKNRNVANIKNKDNLADVLHKKTVPISSGKKKMSNAKTVSVANIKNNNDLAETVDNVADGKSISSAKNKVSSSDKEAHGNGTRDNRGDRNPKYIKKSVLPLKTLNNPKTGINKVTKAGKVSNTGNSERENGAGSIHKSKIPQKKLPPVTESVTKKNPLRISPRKFVSKLKSSDSNIQKEMQKPATSIPRLMKHVSKRK